MSLVWRSDAISEEASQAEASHEPAHGAGKLLGGECAGEPPRVQSGREGWAWRRVLLGRLGERGRKGPDHKGP